MERMVLDVCPFPLLLINHLSSNFRSLRNNEYAICLPKELDPMFKNVFSMVLVSILDLAKD
jgi:hypothetical protein